MRTHAEWKVLTHMMRARLPTRASTRCFISLAALLVKVIARIDAGWALRSEISQAIRRVSTRVLPEPAPATTSRGAPSWTTARRCGSLSPARSSSRLGLRRLAAPESVASSAASAAGRPGIGNCMLMSPQPYGAGGTVSARDSAGGAERAPVVVEGAVGLHEPHDGQEDQEDPGEVPETRDRTHRRLSACALVELADLVRG